MKTQYKFFILLLCICFFPNSLLFAQAGSLDPSFGNNGIVYNDKHDPHGYALQADGKMLVSGDDFIIDRYNQDGSIDAGFGNNGTVKVLVNREGSFKSVLYNEDGKILASGSIQSDDYTHFNIILVQCFADGRLDSSFGENGIVITDYGVNFYNRSMTIQADGKIVITGERSANVNDLNKTFVIRYNGDGTLDNTFGSEGIVITNYKRQVTSLQIVIQPDGKILTSGTYGYLNDLPFFMATRYMADGQIDESFGENGIALSGYFGINPQGIWHTRMQDMVLQPDNKILVGGQTGTGEINTGLCRFNSDGSLDMSFGIEGKVITSVENFQTPTYGIALQPDGKIIAGGEYSTKSQSFIYFSMFRYQSNGMLDSSFGENGRVTTPEAGKYAGAEKVILQPDQKILLLGAANNGYSIARYFNDNILADNFKEVKAIQENEAITITWQTLNENNTKSFTVERSGNAKDFVGISTIPAKHAAGNSYSYTDKNPLYGDNYYRIKENAANGTNTYSQTLKVIFENSNTISLYPNPAKNTVTIKGLNKNATAVIKITDMNGREISKQNFSNTSSTTLSIRALAQGSYFILVEQNGKVTKLRMVKE